MELDTALVLKDLGGSRTREKHPHIHQGEQRQCQLGQPLEFGHKEGLSTKKHACSSKWRHQSKIENRTKLRWDEMTTLRRERHEELQIALGKECSLRMLVTAWPLIPLVQMRTDLAASSWHWCLLLETWRCAAELRSPEKPGIPRSEKQNNSHIGTPRERAVLLEDQQPASRTKVHLRIRGEI